MVGDPNKIVQFMEIARERGCDPEDSRIAEALKSKAAICANEP